MRAIVTIYVCANHRIEDHRLEPHTVMPQEQRIILDILPDLSHSRIFEHRLQDAEYFLKRKACGERVVRCGSYRCFLFLFVKERAREIFVGWFAEQNRDIECFSRTDGETDTDDLCQVSIR